MQLKFYQNLIPETFGIVLSLVAGVIIYISRIGFENDFSLILISLGISFFLILTPEFIANKFFLKKYVSKSLLLFFCFIFLMVLSYISQSYDIPLYPLVILISLFLLFNFLLRLKKKKELQVNYIIFIIFVLFGVFALTAHYHFQYISPLMKEQIMIGASAHRDPVWHATLSGMFKTYDKLSIGLDGLTVPFLNYHLFSNIIIGLLSSLLNTSTIKFYSIVFPIIILPFFFMSFLYSVREVSRFFFDKKKHFLPDEKNYTFWILLLILFSMPLSFTLSPEDLFFYLQSYSYSFASIFLFILIGITFSAISYITFDNKSTFYPNFVFLLIFPIIFFMVCYSKISFLYLIIVIYLYLFLRLKLFKYKPQILTFLILIILSCYFYFYLIIPMQNNFPGNSWQKDYSSLILEYPKNIFPSLIFIFFKFYWLKIKSFEKFVLVIKEKKLIDVEILCLLIVTLFIIPMNYFQEVQLFIAFILLTTYSKPFLKLIHV